MKSKALKLPDGYSVGDKVISTVEHEPDHLKIGDTGTVLGPCSNPALSDREMRVYVNFSGKVLNMHTKTICKQARVLRSIQILFISTYTHCRAQKADHIQ